MKRTMLFILLTLALILSACEGDAQNTEVPEFSSTSEVAVPETTQAPTEEPTEKPTQRPTETEEQSLEPSISALAPGYYVVSSVGRDGDVTFYGSPDPENGYLELFEDGTGFLFFDGVEGELTWEAKSVLWNGQEIPGACLSYYDSELGQEDGMLVLYFTDPVVSVILRPMQAPLRADAAS